MSKKVFINNENKWTSKMFIITVLLVYGSNHSAFCNGGILFVHHSFTVGLFSLTRNMSSWHYLSEWTRVYTNPRSFVKWLYWSKVYHISCNQTIILNQCKSQKRSTNIFRINSYIQARLTRISWMLYNAKIESDHSRIPILLNLVKFYAKWVS